MLYAQANMLTPKKIGESMPPVNFVVGRRPRLPTDWLAHREIRQPQCIVVSGWSPVIRDDILTPIIISNKSI